MNLRTAFAASLFLICHASEGMATPKPGHHDNGRPLRAVGTSDYCYDIPATSPVNCRGLNDSGQPLGAADIVGGTIHGTTYNDERIWAATGKTAMELKWQVLQRDSSKAGSVSPFPATPTPDGNVLYWTPGADAGFPNVYAVDAHTGKILWETEPWPKDPDCPYDNMNFDPQHCNNDKRMPDPWTYFVAPIVDDLGNAYIGDLDQLWAYSPEPPPRRQKYKHELWVIDIAEPCGGRPWAGNAVIYKRDRNSPRLLAAACTGGSFILVNIEAGVKKENRLLASLPIPNITPTPCLPILGDLFWARGEETFLRTAREGVCGGAGIGLKFTETQAFDPATATIYQAGASDRGTGGKVYAVRIVQKDGNWGLELAWTNEQAGAMQTAGTTSPTIEYLTDIDPTADPTAAVVYASDKEGVMYAFDTKDGHLVGKSDGGLTVGFSPQVAFNGYLTNANDSNMIALKLDVKDGHLSEVPGWGEQNWEFLLDDKHGDLTTGPSIEPLPNNTTVDPNPKYTFQGVVPQYLNHLTAPAALVYTGTQNVGGVPGNFYSTFKQAIVNVDIDTGKYIADSYALAYPQRGSWMGGGCIGRWGGVCDSYRAEGRSKPWLNTVDKTLRELNPAGATFYEQGYVPGGLQGMVPVSPVSHARDVIDFMANDMCLKAATHVSEGRSQLAFDVVRKLPPNTTRQAYALVEMAEENNEISPGTAATVKSYLVNANEFFETARKQLINSGAGPEVIASLASGRKELNDALSRLPQARKH